MNWSDGTLIGFDLETSGVDTETARIVTATIIEVDVTSREVRTTNWLADPGIEVADLSALQGMQAAWFREQSASFESYLRKCKARDGASPAEVAAVSVSGDWPLRPFQAVTV